MKLDLKQLKKIEEEYATNYICRISLEEMIKNILNFDDLNPIIPSNILLSINTLKDLKILVDEKIITNEKQQLNS